MLDKLQELKHRAESLYPNDNKNLDDIRRKTKMYLERIFPAKFTYPGEVDAIRFHPLYVGSYTSSRDYVQAWNKGKEELINLLDTRIEEYKILNRQAQLSIQQNERKPQKVEVIEKIVKIEDTSKIEKLTLEYNMLRSKKTLWERINLIGAITIALTIMGGSFMLGKFIGENRFDQEKLDLVDKNKNLNSINDSTVKVNEMLKKRIFFLEDTLSRQTKTEEK